jgi:oligosaccharide repeat unit polymerase
MSLLLVSFFSVVGIISGKLLFKKWFNHLTLYCIIWGVMLFLYEWKLLPYTDITPLTWFYIISGFCSFLFGILTIRSARNLKTEHKFSFKDPQNALKIFIDGGKTVKYALLFFSLISLYGALQHWSVLIDKFGSVAGVFLNASTIYRLNASGGIKGQVPFIAVLAYVAIFFSGVYTAYKGRFSFLTFLPFLGIIIKELATIGRAGILLGLVEFLVSFFLFRNLLSDDPSKKFRFSKKNAVISFTLLIVFFIASISLVRISRGSFEHYSGASRELNQFKGNIIFTPSVYLYLSSHVGVLSKYVSSEREDTKFGQNTFLTLYHVLNKFDLVERDSDYQKGYFIPMWTNTGTYLRELDADFGIIGLLVIPYLLGVFITWFWYKFYEDKNLIVFTLLVYLYLIVGLSFFIMISRTSYWSISLLVTVLSIPVLEKIAGFVNSRAVE